MLGVGGMGEVYQARDARLKRDVALKVLPELFAFDRARLARFKREAQVLASLNHPNIGAIYGFEESNGIQALVLELVDGPTLADRLTDGTIPLREALGVAKQMADALEAAHAQGIIHRDLKPSNVKVRDDGTVKLLDFGLAKALDTKLTGPTSNSSTVTSPALTQMGIMLGTPAYMAPEQVRGKVMDGRADIWAFGCLVFEMLAGCRAFPGATISDTIAKILEREPDWQALPASTPPSVRRLLTRCLEKDAKRRLHSIADARFEIDESLVERASPERHARRKEWFAGVITASLLSVIAYFAYSRKPPTDPNRTTVLPAAPLTAFPGFESEPSLSPDGSQVAFSGSGQTQDNFDIYVKLVGPGEPVRLTTDPALDRSAAWSPDGRLIAFQRFNGGGAADIFTVPALGGAERKIATINPRRPTTRNIRGGGNLSWTPDNKWIAFGGAPSQTEAAGIWLVAVDGRQIRRLTEPGSTSYGDWQPAFSHNGRYLAFVRDRYAGIAWRLRASVVYRFHAGRCGRAGDARDGDYQRPGLDLGR